MSQSVPPVPNSKKPQPDPVKGFLKSFALIVFVVVIAIGIASQFTNQDDKAPAKTEITLAELSTKIQAGTITELVVRGQKVEGTLADKTIVFTKKEPESTIAEQLQVFGVTPEQLTAVQLQVKNENDSRYWMGVILPFLIPVLLMLGLLWILTRQVKGSGMKAFSFGQTNARITDPEKHSVTFADVAGNNEAKQELEEIVDFLKFPKKYLEIGAKIPRGVLLAGSPGTGKTLLARAVAGEAGVPFFHLSGSEFVEMFVGVGASRVRDLFSLAKKAAPAIVFIDEIDAVGRHRGVGVGGGNDEREQTLNQILVEMDGFEQNEAVIVLAATNRADVLDEALLRPGRFDRRVVLTNPDKKDRAAILAIHAKKKKLTGDVDLSIIAGRTPGFSGADLESLMNEAAIRAARANRTELSQEDIIMSIEKVMLGPERRGSMNDADELKLVAYHEAGHAVIASVLPDSDPVHKVTIVPRGYAGGYTLKLPIDEKRLRPSKAYHADLVVSLGGMMAEQLIYGDITPGASSDLQNATSTARNMVAKWGMNSTVGPIAIDTLSRSAGFGEVGTTASEKTLETVDAEIRSLLESAKQLAKELLATHRDLLEEITRQLLEKETIEREEFNDILRQFNITVKESLTEGEIVEPHTKVA
jgi:cell division protease FtsH